MDKEEEQIFWIDDFEGEAQGGYFIRNDLFKFFGILKEKGLKPVGIKCDGGWNLEIIVANQQTKDNE